MAPSVLVVGLGNPDRGDDGIGPAVAARLLERVPAGVEVRSRAGDALALLEDWRGHDAVVLIDAAAPQGAPGRIHRVDLIAETLPPALAPASTHAFGLAEALALSATLGERPRMMILIAVEAVDFTTGAPLSPAVGEAIAPAIALALQEVARILG